MNHDKLKTIAQEAAKTIKTETDLSPTELTDLNGRIKTAEQRMEIPRP